jgi:hypothetical protein
MYHELKARAIGFDVAKEFRMDGIFNGAALVKVKLLILFVV